MLAYSAAQTETQDASARLRSCFLAKTRWDSVCLLCRLPHRARASRAQDPEAQVDEIRGAGSYPVHHRALPCGEPAKDRLKRGLPPCSLRCKAQPAVDEYTNVKSHWFQNRSILHPIFSASESQGYDLVLVCEVNLEAESGTETRVSELVSE